MLLHGELTAIVEGIQNREYSTMDFASCMLKEILKKFPKTDDDQKCVDLTRYLTLLVKQIRERSFFKNESAFSTENLRKEMEEIGFSKRQIRCFRAKLDAD